jgi:hypothetical protein
MREISLMLKVLWSPGAAFAQIRENRVRPWIPILVFIAFGLAGTYLLTNRVDIGEALMREILRSPQAGNMSQEQIIEMRGNMSNNPVIIGLMYGASIFLPLMALVASGLYFGIFLILGSRSSFLEFWSATTFSFTPMLLSSIAGIAVMFTIPPAALQLGQMNVLSPAVFMDPTGGTGPGYALAQALSLTTIWSLVLLIIGYGILGSGRTNVVVRSVVVLVP